MLFANEFSVGALANATPLSLILPRNQYEATALVGTLKDTPAAVFLSGQFAFSFLPSVDNHSWKGLIIPNVRVEVDPTSLYNGDNIGGGLGTVIRMDTRLIVKAKSERFYGDGVSVTLHDGLTPCAEGYTAGFANWQVVLGEGQDKRVLWRVPDTDDKPSSVNG